jgi:hypothetical protein
MNRETWLTKATEKMTPMLAEHGYTVPKVRVSCGWPSKGATSARSRRIGECWHGQCIADGTREIFISPTLADPAEVAGVLIHELGHAVLPEGAGHGATFGKFCRTLGLSMPATSATPEAELAAKLAKLLKPLGDYPHAKLTPGAGKKQSTRLRKIECPECGYTARVTAKWIDVGLPTCCCGCEMTADV